MTDPLLDIIGDKILQELPEADRRSCRLLGPTALVVQGLMGVLVISSLVLKRHREKPMRPWRIWIFDVSKQVVGQMFVHGVNVLISDLVAHHSSGNPCVLYFLNILIDTTLGVVIIYLILHLITFVFSEKLHLKGFKSGQYGDPPSFMFWARQAAVYVFSLTTMKLLVVALFVLWPGIFKIGAWLLSWTGESDAVQVIVVMGLFPIAMNIIQFWLIDSIVKASASTLETDVAARRPGDHEPLIGDDDDYDEGDLDASTETRYDIENPCPPSSSTSVTNESRKLLNEEEQKISSSSSSSKGTAYELAEQETTHAYPPPLSSSLSTVSSLESKFESRLFTRKRSPPPPLLLSKFTLPHSSTIVTSSPTPRTGSIPIKTPRRQSNIIEIVHPDDLDNLQQRRSSSEWHSDS